MYVCSVTEVVRNRSPLKRSVGLLISQLIGKDKPRMRIISIVLLVITASALGLTQVKNKDANPKD
jgi:hypothetical protein